MFPYREIWLCDFEFIAQPGERPDPVCLVAREYKSGRLVRLWRDEMGDVPPYPTDAGALFVAYYASAELGCHLALGWPMPARILDLFAEFRNHTNGRDLPAGRGLLGALAYFGLDGIEAAEKRSMIDRILRGGPWRGDERAAILDYCQSDVDAMRTLLPALGPRVDLPRALLRGRYMAAAARIEWAGVPIDVPMLGRLRKGWHGIQDRLIAEIDRDYRVFDGRTFKAERFARYLVASGIPWPRTETDRLSLHDDTFRQMAKAYPAVAPLRELRSSLAEMRLQDLAVGSDGRNRTMLSAFGLL